ncbi:cytochrome b/b6 domain-containing protein [Erythrobacter aurantius]|uniref:cytochrome b/b6 domain-containing protein n=1 Tax=Erythrobacter aurantius TaxID=2909249 RepID=UPI002079D943|nr:cytochrome b/b6 domain-containing protein [Erythrobacter aurantius]
MTQDQTPAKRWDPLVKITHWGVAAIVVCNALIVGEGSIAHIWAGYTLAGLLSLRLLWGVIGTRPARFASFPPSPSRALAHIRAIREGRREEHDSHNPLGALMAYAIWACIGVIVASGIAMAGAPPAIDASTTPAQIISGEAEEGEHGEYREHGEDDEYGEGGEEDEGEEVLEEVHEIAVNLLYLLILLHIGGVAFETARSGKRTITAMLPGGK